MVLNREFWNTNRLTQIGAVWNPNKNCNSATGATGAWIARPSHHRCPLQIPIGWWKKRGLNLALKTMNWPYRWYIDTVYQSPAPNRFFFTKRTWNWFEHTPTTFNYPEQSVSRRNLQVCLRSIFAQLCKPRVAPLPLSCNVGRVRR